MSRLLRYSLFAIVSAFVALAATGSATAWPQPGGPGSPVTLTYSYENMFDGGLLKPNGQPLEFGLIKRSIEEALGLWASVVPLHFVEVPDQGGQFGQIRFRHQYLGGQDPLVGQPVLKARAYYPSYPGNLAGDVEFDDGDRWQKNGTLSIPDILGAAVHELGHALGLGHSSVQQSNEFWYWLVYNSTGGIETHAEPKGAANMFWIFNRYTGPGSAFLFQDDITRIRQYYGAGVGSVTPLIPEPSTLALVFLAAGWWITRRRTRCPR